MPGNEVSLVVRAYADARQRKLLAALVRKFGGFKPGAVAGIGTVSEEWRRTFVNGSR